MPQKQKPITKNATIIIVVKEELALETESEYEAKEL